MDSLRQQSLTPSFLYSSSSSAKPFSLSNLLHSEQPSLSPSSSSSTTTMDSKSREHESSRRVKSELLVQVDGVNNIPTCEDGHRKIVMVLAATNFSWDIDEALRLHIYIPFPNFESRKELIRINLKTIEVATDVDIDEVARRTEGYSEDALTNITSKARDEIKNMPKDEISNDPVAMCDFEEALWKVQRSISQADMEKQGGWFPEFGSA
ncbi:hypothetical protein POPTR_017G013601v4 [Populus trichocarpa]|uniref:Uncharacterized protein n=1 Tax=Populus trichocarpa TaxID=3694 RepID=A0ACC0RQ96_POPTR|nr:hypothetical protein POPTR_017G013601v4 [Populus trichocarpa]